MIDVSRETIDRLKVYESLLHKWQKTQNLVSSSTLERSWQRHFEDSLQLLELSDHTEWVDMGSGAGFPGLVIAIARPHVKMTLIESNKGKCAFLQEVARQTGTKITILSERIETALPKLAKEQKTFCARALAPLTMLCALIEPSFGKESIALFMKGRNLEEELAEAHKHWDFSTQIIPSITDKEAAILKITKLNQRVI